MEFYQVEVRVPTPSDLTDVRNLDEIRHNLSCSNKMRMCLRLLVVVSERLVFVGRMEDSGRSAADDTSRESGVGTRRESLAKRKSSLNFGFKSRVRPREGSRLVASPTRTALECVRAAIALDTRSYGKLTPRDES